MSFHGEDSENVNPDIPDEQKPILERLRHLSGEMDPMALDLNQLTSSNSIRLNFGLPACPGQKGPSNHHQDSRINQHHRDSQRNLI